MEGQKQITPQICEVCKKPCIPLPSSHNLASSEWYCQTDHKSYPMDVDTARAILIMEARMKKG